MGTADATVLSTSLKSVKLPGSTCVLLYMAITSSSLFHFIHKGRLTPRIAAYEGIWRVVLVMFPLSKEPCTLLSQSGHVLEIVTSIRAFQLKIVSSSILGCGEPTT